VAAQLAGELVRVFDRQEDTVNVLFGVLLTNTSEHVLAPGPCGVFRDGRFVSERQFYLTPPADAQLLTYGEDGSISASVNVEKKSVASRLELTFDEELRTDNDGVDDDGADDTDVEKRRSPVAKGLRLVTRHTNITTYRFENHGDDQVLLLNHVADVSSAIGFVFVCCFSIDI
jgi:hypothetical protein